MVSINIGAGQGVTQAIASKLGLSKDDLKKINLSTWQNVMTEVSNAQSQIDKHNASNNGDKQKSIFTGGRDVKTINQQSNWKSNFVVQQGTVEINDSSWNKIVQMLTGKSAGGTQEPPAPVENKPSSPAQDAVMPETIELTDDVNNAVTESMVDSLGGKIIERSVNGEKQDIAVVEINGQKVRRAINEDGTLGDTLASTKTFGKNKYIAGDFPPETKILEREVNGKKSQIGIYEDENGNKVRKLVVTDEQTGKTSLGENLVTVSTMGKNKYVTESKFNADVKTMLGLSENDEIPADLKAEYVTIGGESSIVIKKDGKVMDRFSLKQYMANYKNSEQRPESQTELMTTAMSEFFDLRRNPEVLENYSSFEENMSAEQRKEAAKISSEFWNDVPVKSLEDGSLGLISQKGGFLLDPEEDVNNIKPFVNMSSNILVSGKDKYLQLLQGEKDVSTFQQSDKMKSINKDDWDFLISYQFILESLNVDINKNGEFIRKKDN